MASDAVLITLAFIFVPTMAMAIPACLIVAIKNLHQLRQAKEDWITEDLDFTDIEND